MTTHNNSKSSGFQKQCIQEMRHLVQAEQKAAHQALQLTAHEPHPTSCANAKEHPLYQHKAFQPLSAPEVTAALSSDPVCQRILAKQLKPESGQLVGIRLNLNVLKHTGLAMQTVHKAPLKDQRHLNKGFFNGEALHYQQAVTLHNAYFNVDQNARELIASGERAKSAMASIDGEYDDAPITQLEGIEISFNPIKTHLFVDSNGYAIRFAEHVTICGHRAYASGRIEWHSLETAPERAEATHPSLALIAGPHPAPQVKRSISA